MPGIPPSASNPATNSTCHPNSAYEAGKDRNDSLLSAAVQDHSRFFLEPGDLRLALGVRQRTDLFDAVAQAFLLICNLSRWGRGSAATSEKNRDDRDEYPHN